MHSTYLLELRRYTHCRLVSKHECKLCVLTSNLYRASLMISSCELSLLMKTSGFDDGMFFTMTHDFIYSFISVCQLIPFSSQECPKDL